MIGSTISKRYAKALLSLGREDGRYADYGKDLEAFSDICRKHGEFKEVISNQIFPIEDRKKILQSILDKCGFSDTVNHFLCLLLDKNRIRAVEEITAYYEKLTDEISNIARAEIITPGPLGEDVRAKLEKVLADLTSRTVKAEVREDKDIIGGIVVKIGDLVLDGSVKAQLEGLKESLKRGEYV